jgi:hypothetical protein
MVPCPPPLTFRTQCTDARPPSAFDRDSECSIATGTAQLHAHIGHIGCAASASSPGRAPASSNPGMQHTAIGPPPAFSQAPRHSSVTGVMYSAAPIGPAECAPGGTSLVPIPSPQTFETWYMVVVPPPPFNRATRPLDIGRAGNARDNISQSCYASRTEVDERRVSSKGRWLCKLVSG